ncbi:hypothetical protein ABID42_003857 [Arcicella rosea]|uniref:hypothetical protein n=1 Tax=Arcicella rosea TaxID=502909 RepID=UPI00345D1BE7
MRKLITNYWSQIITFCVVILGLYLFTFYLYPSLIHGYLIKNVKGYNISNDLLGRGTYGDMYGALNTFFSGLAFIGLIVTIGIQIYLHEEEKNSDKLEKVQNDSDKLTYLKALFEKTIKDISIIQNSLKEKIETLKSESLNSKSVNIDSKMNFWGINKIIAEINQEEYFLSYKRVFKKDDIINAFKSFEEMDIRIKNMFQDSLNNNSNFNSDRQNLLLIVNELFNSLYQLKQDDEYTDALSKQEYILIQHILTIILNRDLDSLKRTELIINKLETIDKELFEGNCFSFDYDNTLLKFKRTLNQYNYSQTNAIQYLEGELKYLKEQIYTIELIF